jgi:hypothetical protein
VIKIITSNLSNEFKQFRESFPSFYKEIREYREYIEAELVKGTFPKPSSINAMIRLFHIQLNNLEIQCKHIERILQ